MGYPAYGIQYSVEAPRRKRQSIGGTSHKDANSPRLLGTLWWSEKSGGLVHRQRRRMQRKWLGLTGQEWGFFAGVAGLAFAAGLAVLRVWG